MFVLNLILAIAWVLLTGQFTPVNFLIGFILVYLTLRLTQQSTGGRRYLRKVGLTIRFSLFFLWELILASMRTTLLVLSPKMVMRPAVVRVPLDVKTDGEITLLANLITLTPGTLSLDVSPDKRYLYVHVFNLESREAFVRDIKFGFERRVMEVMR